MSDVERCHRCGSALVIEQINVSYSLAEPEFIRGRVECPVCDAHLPRDETEF